MCESFFATLECELFENCDIRSHSEASMALVEFSKGWVQPTPAALRSSLFHASGEVSVCKGRGFPTRKSWFR